jgi:hypothetical protein
VDSDSNDHTVRIRCMVSARLDMCIPLTHLEFDRDDGSFKESNFFFSNYGCYAHFDHWLTPMFITYIYIISSSSLETISTNPASTIPSSSSSLSRSPLVEPQISMRVEAGDARFDETALYFSSMSATISLPLPSHSCRFFVA